METLIMRRGGGGVPAGVCPGNQALLLFFSFSVETDDKLFPLPKEI